MWSKRRAAWPDSWQKGRVEALAVFCTLVLFVYFIFRVGEPRISSEAIEFLYALYTMEAQSRELVRSKGPCNAFAHSQHEIGIYAALLSSSVISLPVDSIMQQACSTTLTPKFSRPLCTPLDVLCAHCRPRPFHRPYKVLEHQRRLKQRLALHLRPIHLHSPRIAG